LRRAISATPADSRAGGFLGLSGLLLGQPDGGLDLPLIARSERVRLGRSLILKAAPIPETMRAAPLGPLADPLRV
jgi:hypothetical protein